jgi:hypothetical protein
MKLAKSLAIALLAYVAIVVAFESLIGVFQPAGEATLVITTVDSDGSRNDRVLSRLDSDGQLYVAANHWPRAWYREALANPNVQVDLGETSGDYSAVPIEGDESDRVNRDNGVHSLFRLLTGFPPRLFLRLDPV